MRRQSKQFDLTGFVVVELPQEKEAKKLEKQAAKQAARAEKQKAKRDKKRGGKAETEATEEFTNVGVTFDVE